MEFDLKQVCFLDYRTETFKTSVFAKSRAKCSPKNFAEAGFYYTPDDNNDKVTCYACNVSIFGWKKNADDPWTEHTKANPDCCYLKRKKSYKNELTVYEFLEIEKERLIMANKDAFNRVKKKIELTMDNLDKNNLLIDNTINLENSS